MAGSISSGPSCPVEKPIQLGVAVFYDVNAPYTQRGHGAFKQRPYRVSCGT